MNCTGCGAPLAPDTLVCPFCRLHNAVDLLAIRDFKLLSEHSSLQCANGCGDLQILRLGAGLDCDIGFCPQCKGMHFAPGSVDIALKRVAAQVRAINHDRVEAIMAERIVREAVRYRPCPVCQSMMHRHAFSQRIPLIIDECRKHGSWLDGGEFSILAEWAEAGGAQLAEQEAQRRARVEGVAGVSQSTSSWERPQPDASSEPGYRIGREERKPSLLRDIAHRVVLALVVILLMKLFVWR